MKPRSFRILLQHVFLSISFIAHQWTPSLKLSSTNRLNMSILPTCSKTRHQCLHWTRPPLSQTQITRTLVTLVWPWPWPRDLDTWPHNLDIWPYDNVLRIQFVGQGIQTSRTDTLFASLTLILIWWSWYTNANVLKMYLCTKSAVSRWRLSKVWTRTQQTDATESLRPRIHRW